MAFLFQGIFTCTPSISAPNNTDINTCGRFEAIAAHTNQTAKMPSKVLLDV
jgi:hypothetical protein